MKKKMSLNNLQVKSFVTNLGNNNAETIKGGGDALTHTQPTAVCGGCEIQTDQACHGGGGSGWVPSNGCSNNSCAECHVV